MDNYRVRVDFGMGFFGIIFLISQSGFFILGYFFSLNIEKNSPVARDVIFLSESKYAQEKSRSGRMAVSTKNRKKT